MAHHSYNKKSRNIDSLLAYKKQFQSMISDKIKTVPESKPFSQIKYSKIDASNDTIVGVVIEDIEHVQDFRCLIPRNPNLHICYPSLNYANEPRISFTKASFDFVFNGKSCTDEILFKVGENVLHMATQGGTGLFLCCGNNEQQKVENFLNLILKAVDILLHDHKEQLRYSIIHPLASELQFLENKSGTFQVKNLKENDLKSEMQLNSMIDQFLGCSDDLVVKLQAKKRDETENGSVYFVFLSEENKRFDRNHIEKRRRSHECLRECLQGKFRFNNNQNSTYKVREDLKTRGKVLKVAKGVS